MKIYLTTAGKDGTCTTTKQPQSDKNQNHHCTDAHNGSSKPIATMRTTFSVQRQLMFASRAQKSATRVFTEFFSSLKHTFIVIGMIEPCDFSAMGTFPFQDSWWRFVKDARRRIVYPIMRWQCIDIKLNVAATMETWTFNPLSGIIHNSRRREYGQQTKNTKQNWIAFLSKKCLAVGMNCFSTKKVKGQCMSMKHRHGHGLSLLTEKMKQQNSKKL
jgi:hypothetical protein